MSHPYPFMRHERRCASFLAAGVVLASLVFFPAGVPTAESFALPKEFFVAAVAACGLVTLICASTLFRLDIPDFGLLAFVVAGAASAIFVARDGWAAARSLTLMMSWVASIVVARSVTTAQGRRVLIFGVHVAVLVCAAGILLDSYSNWLNWSPFHLRPGGTIGNRNRAAHLIALSVPVLLITPLPSRRWLAIAAECAVCAAALTLTRSRAAWLALAVGIVAFVLVESMGEISTYKRAWSRRLLIVGGAVTGVFAALVLPNKLQWESSTPYLDSVREIFNYHDGSGRARVEEAIATSEMIAAHPVLGVGPGNWRLTYAAIRDARRRASYWSANRLAQCEWLGIWAEYGTLATISLLIAVATLLRAGQAVKQPDDAITAIKTSGGAWMFAAIWFVLAVLDAIVTTPQSAIMVAIAIGLFAPRVRGVGRDSGRLRKFAVPLGVVLGAALTIEAGRAVAGYMAREMERPPNGLQAALRIYPGDIDARLQLTAYWEDRGRCDRAIAHLAVLRVLTPTLPLTRALSKRCPQP